uniref:Putative ribonuclease H-like domain-containing protein n=1 Tax=Tanacetum cinerariifolium TaxID=118510 RepID=A0A6L2JXQ1_TANCI|nr:putative ribonuclease H-like domain-containing protein [Tanacetum cinerariifolium]
MFGQDKDANSNRMFLPISAAGSTYVNLCGSIPVNATTLPNADLPTDPLMPDLEDTADLQDTGIFSGAYDDEVEGADVDFNNLELTTVISSIPTTRIHNDLPKEQMTWDPLLASQTRRMIKTSQEHAMVFAPVLRIKAIRLLLAYASFMGFIMYNMDVKSAFLYGTLEVEVYVCQPPGFEDLYFPNKVYKVEKALYGLHQAPRAWHETLSTNLLENRFRRGIIDNTLFIKKEKGDILLVQVYIDDIIFGSTKKSLCTEFEGLMHKKFQMSSIGELTFFLRLQVMQRDDGIFISQDKYVADILKKFKFSSVKTTITLIETNKALIKDEEAKDIDVYLYRSMIGSLMYVTTSRPDIMFAVCACARFQVTPKVSHLHVMKRIFRYLKGQPKLGLWYPRDSPFYLEAFSDSDHAGASLDRKSTTGGCQFLGKRLISWQCKKQTVVVNSTTKAEYVAAANCCRHMALVMNLEFKLDLKWRRCLDWYEIEANDEIQVTVVGLTYYHNANFVISFHTKKVFANIKREGKDFSSRVTPLFQSMIVQAPKDIGEGSKIPTDPHHTPIVTQSSSSLPQKKQKSRRKQKKEIKVPSPSSEIPNKEGVPKNSIDPLPTASEKVKQSVKVIEKKVSTVDPVTTTGEVVTAAGIEVATAATTLQISKDELTLAQTSIEIKAAKSKAITTAATIVTDVGTRPKEKGIVMQKPSETPSPKLIKAFVPMDTKLVKDSDKAIEGSKKAKEGSSKRATSNLEQRDAKRERLEEENESAELKRCLEIIHKDDDDVKIETTTLSSKSPTIFYYKIYKEGRKSYFKIIRADVNSQNYLTFGKMFKNFNRVDLEVL